MSLLDPRLWLALLLTHGAIFGAGYWRGDLAGAKSERAAWLTKENARIVAEQAALFKAVEQNERLRQQQEIDNRKVSNAHQAELAALRAEYERPADRLRIAADVCRDFAAAAETDGARRADGAATGAVVLPAALERDLRAAARDADEVTALARAWQDWARRQGLAPELEP